MRSSEVAGAMSGIYDKLRVTHVSKVLSQAQGSQSLPSLGAKVPKSDGLLWWQVNHNEAIDPRLFRILQYSLLAIAQQRIVVAHKQYWCPQSFSSCLSHRLKRRLDRNSILQRLGI